MQSSRRARRMQRHHKRLRRGAGLHLVSLMDVFTILVFFLLVNSSDVQTLPNPKDLRLPESTAEQAAHHNLVVMLTHKQILVDGRPVMGLNAALAENRATLPALARAMIAKTRNRPAPTTAEQAKSGRGEVTIMADKGLPYRLIRKVMLTTTSAHFGRISLAVLQEGQS